MLIYLMVACGVDYELNDVDCDVVDTYLVCSTPVTEIEAWEICSEHNMGLVDMWVEYPTYDKSTWEDVQLIGDAAFNDDWWIYGPPTSECSTMDGRHESMYDTDCNTTHPFICSY